MTQSQYQAHAHYQMQGRPLVTSRDERLAAVGIDSREEDRIETYFNPFASSQYYQPSLDEGPQIDQSHQMSCGSND